MKDLKRKIHYWCSDTMRNKITGKGVVCAVLDTGITQHPAPGTDTQYPPQRKRGLSHWICRYAAWTMRTL